MACALSDGGCGNTHRVGQWTGRGADDPIHGQHHHAQVQWQPGGLDEFERTWNKYVNDLTMGCNEAQRQRS